MAKSPLALVKEKFGNKAELVKSLEQFTSEDLWVGRTNKDKGLGHVSNAKLLRLHAIFSEVKEKFETRAKLIDGILELEKRSKDEGYRTRLSKYPVPRLFDLYRSTSKRLKAAEAKKNPAARRPKKVAPAPAPAKSVAKKSSKNTSSKR